MNLLDCLDINLHEEASAAIDSFDSEYLDDLGFFKYEEFLANLKFAPDEFGGSWYLGDTVPASSKNKLTDVMSQTFSNAAVTKKIRPLLNFRNASRSDLRNIHNMTQEIASPRSNAGLISQPRAK